MLISEDNDNMYCKNCGKQIKDTDTFCPYCGTKCVEIKRTEEEKPKKSKKGIVAVIVGALVFILCAAVAAYFLFFRTAEDPTTKSKNQSSQTKTETSSSESSNQFKGEWVACSANLGYKLIIGDSNTIKIISEYDGETKEDDVSISVSGNKFTTSSSKFGQNIEITKNGSYQLESVGIDGKNITFELITGSKPAELGDIVGRWDFLNTAGYDKQIINYWEFLDSGTMKADRNGKIYESTYTINNGQYTNTYSGYTDTGTLEITPSGKLYGVFTYNGKMNEIGYLLSRTQF